MFHHEHILLLDENFLNNDESWCYFTKLFLNEQEFLLESFFLQEKISWRIRAVEKLDLLHCHYVATKKILLGIYIHSEKLYLFVLKRKFSALIEERCTCVIYGIFEDFLLCYLFFSFLLGNHPVDYTLNANIVFHASWADPDIIYNGDISNILIIWRWRNSFSPFPSDCDCTKYQVLYIFL